MEISRTGVVKPRARGLSYGKSLWSRCSMKTTPRVGERESFSKVEDKGCTGGMCTCGVECSARCFGNARFCCCWKAEVYARGAHGFLDKNFFSMFGLSKVLTDKMEKNV